MSDKPLRVRIPADVDREDRVLGRLTARQVAILAVTGVLLWLVFLATHTWVPLPVFVGAAAPIAGVGLVLAFGCRDGVGLDRLALAALRDARRPRHYVPTTDGALPAPPEWVAHDSTAPLPAPLRLPARAIAENGVVDLGEDGAAVVLACSTVSFALATNVEQEAMVSGSASWLNSLSAPAQILVGTRTVSLEPLLSRLDDAAGGLPHLALEHASRDHATFLRHLAGSADLRTRRVLLILREPVPVGGESAAAADQVARRADDAVRAAAVFGITARRLAAAELTKVLTETADPYGPTAETGGASVVTRRRSA